MTCFPYISDDDIKTPDSVLNEDRSQRVYRRSCRSLNVAPSTVCSNALKEREVILRNRALGPSDIKAFSLALMVSIWGLVFQKLVSGQVQIITPNSTCNHLSLPLIPVSDRLVTIGLWQGYSIVLSMCAWHYLGLSDSVSRYLIKLIGTIFPYNRCSDFIHSDLYYHRQPDYLLHSLFRPIRKNQISALLAIIFFCRSTINWRSWTLPGMSSGLRVPIILPRSSLRISSSQISYVVTSHHIIFRMKILKFNSSDPGQNGRHFGGWYFQIHFLEWKVRILIKISLKFVPKGLINDNSVLV